MHFFIVWVLWGRLKKQTIRAKNHISPGEPDTDTDTDTEALFFVDYM